MLLTTTLLIVMIAFYCCCALLVRFCERLIAPAQDLDESPAASLPRNRRSAHRTQHFLHSLLETSSSWLSICYSLWLLLSSSTFFMPLSTRRSFDAMLKTTPVKTFR